MEGIDWIRLEGQQNGAIRTCGSKSNDCEI